MYINKVSNELEKRGSLMQAWKRRDEKSDRCKYVCTYHRTTLHSITYEQSPRSSLEVAMC